MLRPWLACLLAWMMGIPAWANELGRPIVRDFAPGSSKIAHLSPAAIQDDAGYIYIANGTALRVYDGTSWKLIPVPTESAGVRRFARAAA